MKTDAAKSWFDLGVMLVLLVAMIAMSGCKGGLFGGSHSPDSDLGRAIKVYEINFATGANSIANIGNAGTQSPMYQSPETATEKDGAGPYFTGGTMPATGGANAGTAQGKYVQQNVNDANKRSAESDISAAAQLMAGNTQSNAGQTPATAQRQGTATPTATQTANPQHNPALQLNPNTALTGQGTAQQTNPTSTLAGAGSTPGAVTGGTGAATATSGDGTDGTKGTDGTLAAQPAPAVPAEPVAQPAEASTTNGGPTETVNTVTANPDGTKTVTTESGQSLTGKVMGPFESGGEEVWVLLLSDGTPVKLQASGANASALGQ